MTTQTQELDIRAVSLPSSDMLNRSPLSEAVKEMFNDLKIDMITDLTDDEIKLITRIYMISDMKQISVWKTGVRYYLRLLLSRKRKSRSELLQAIEGAQKRASLWDQIFNRNKEDRPK